MAEFCCQTEPPDLHAREFVERVKTGDAAGVRALLDEVPELVAQIDEPWFAFDAPAVVLATSHDDRAMVETLLDAGADVNARSSWWAGGFGVLDHAPQMADFLISRGAVVDAHAAAALGDLERLTALLDEDPERVHAPGGDGQRPLHFAATREVAELLLERGAEIDIRDVDHHSTAAQYMVDERHEVCRFLVERGARPDLLMAAALGDSELASRLLADHPDAIHCRVGRGEIPGMTDPVENAGHIYQWKLRGAKRPQQVARAFGHLKLYELLMEHSPPADQLLMACWYDEPQRLAALRASHPELGDLLNEEADELFVQAAWDHNETALRHLLALGVDIDVVAGEGCALDRAAVRGYPDLVELLLGHGASTQVRNRYGGTPLGAAVWGAIHMRNPEGDYPQTVRRLLAAEPPDAERLAAMLRFAAAEGGLGMVELLLEQGADPRLPDDDGRTATELAGAAGHHRIVERLRQEV